MDEKGVFLQIFTKEEREELVKKKERVIKRALKAVDPMTVKLNADLIIEAAQYSVCLLECNKIIDRDGLVDTYKNGKNQYGTKKSVAAELKPKYTQTFQSLIRQLSDLLPSDGEKDAAKELMDFVNNSAR